MDRFNENSKLLIVSFAVAIVTCVILSIKRRTKECLPPSPPALPIIGHLHLLGNLPHQALQKVSTKYGPLIHLYLGSVSCIVVSTAEVAKEVLKFNEVSFSNRPNSSAVLSCLHYNGQGFAFAPFGPYWQFVKKLCISDLLGGRALDQHYHVRKEELQMFLRTILSKSKAGESANVNMELMKLNNNTITRMCMGKRCFDIDNDDDVRVLIQEVTELIGKFNVCDFIWFIKNMDLQGIKKRVTVLQKKIDLLIEKIIKEKVDRRTKTKASGEDGFRDLLDILLDVQADTTADMKFTQENIKAFILDVLVAGTDTSAISVEWAMAELINHPDIFQKAREEIDLVVGKERLVAESDIPNLPYLHAIVKESFRLHSTTPLNIRESAEACKIGGYDIPANTRLFVNAWAIGRDPNEWENSLEFRPERFLISDKSDKKIDVRGQHFNLLPFGSGRRGCIGISLALAVVQTTLACMIQCFDWKNAGDGMVDMLEAPGFNLKRVNPLVCFPTSRLDTFPMMT